MQFQPEFTGGVQRAFRSELLRREVDAAVKRAVTPTPVAEGVPPRTGLDPDLQPRRRAGPPKLSGPDARVHPQWDQSGVPLPALPELGELEERVQGRRCRGSACVTAWRLSALKAGVRDRDAVRWAIPCARCSSPCGARRPLADGADILKTTEALLRVRPQGLHPGSSADWPTSFDKPRSRSWLSR